MNKLKLKDGVAEGKATNGMRNRKILIRLKDFIRNFCAMYDSQAPV